MREFGPLGRLALLVLLGTMAATEVVADQELARAAARYRAWRWRPGRAELVGRVRLAKRDVLIGRDPVTGRSRRLLDVDEARHVGRRAGAGHPLRRIGRAAPPDLVWEPSGRGLVVVAKGDLVWAHLETGLRRRLTRTRASLRDVKVAPGGQHVSFVRDHELWVVPTKAGRPRQLTYGGTEASPNAELDWMIPEEFGLSTAHWWSPDGTRIAFLQLDQSAVPEVEIDGVRMRYPRVGDPIPTCHVGVVAVEGGRLRWLDLGEDEARRAYVPRVGWFPDSAHLAVTVLDRPQRNLRLLEVPISGAASRVLLHEHDPRWVSAPPSAGFVDGRHFLWRSERDGWARWYLATLPDEGANQVRLDAVTAPGVETWERPCFDRKRGEAHYVASVEDGYRRTPLSGSEGRSLIFSPPLRRDVSARFDAGGSWVIIHQSGVLQPPSAMLCRVADGIVQSPLGGWPPPPRSADAGSRPETGHLGAGSDRITWRLWHPQGDPPDEPRPLVVHVYGGPGSRSVRDAWSGGNLVQRFTKRGIYVLQVDGRGTQGYGAEHRCAIHGRLGLLEIEDQVRAVRHLTKRPEIDATRVGITGWSFGGTMTCLALLRHPDVFRTGVAIAPVTDWRLYDAAYTERYLGLLEENPKGYAEASPIAYAAALRGRLLLIHGEADDNVHVENTRCLAESIEAAGRGDLLDVILFPGVGHGLGRYNAEAWKRTDAFLEGHLSR